MGRIRDSHGVAECPDPLIRLEAVWGVAWLLFVAATFVGCIELHHTQLSKMMQF